jgi:WhiB family redox-sensing transcriptional regulator
MTIRPRRFQTSHDRPTQWSPGAAGPVLAHDPDAGWRNLAACGEVDPELFFSAKGEQVAKSVCRRCPVRGACMKFALKHEIRAGVSGGLTETERRPLHDARGARLLAKGCKYCPACCEVKPVGAFGPHTRAADGLQGSCVACRAKVNASPAECANGHMRTPANTGTRSDGCIYCLDCPRGSFRGSQREEAAA